MLAIQLEHLKWQNNGKRNEFFKYYIKRLYCSMMTASFDKSNFYTQKIQNLSGGKHLGHVALS